MLTEQIGKPVVMIDVVPVRDGDTFTITFQSQTSGWRQGIWLGVDGELEVNGEQASQLVVWTDTAPPTFMVKVVRASDGLLRLYNVWDSERGIRPHESQSYTSGMLKEVNGNRIVYRCNDIGTNPMFDKLVFELGR